MADPYLIAHKVCGQPAFDVAIRMKCPECGGNGGTFDGSTLLLTCHECDGLGFWWIIPTSGHRAYPWYAVPYGRLMMLVELAIGAVPEYIDRLMPPMPIDLPDHYPDHGTAPKINLVEALGLKPVAPAKIERRL